MPNPLLHELSHHKYLRHKLVSDYPDIDEETLLDTLEGLTDLHEMIAAVTRSRLDDLAISSALRSRITDMQERLSRIEHRADKAKDIVVDVMERAGIKKVSEADFTVSEAGTNVIVSALTANPDARKLLDERLGDAAIGYIRCSIDTCAARDPKGLYAKAKSGEIDTLVGFNTEYPALDNPDIILDTENDPLDALVEQTVEYLRRSGRLI